MAVCAVAVACGGEEFATKGTGGAGGAGGASSGGVAGQGGSGASGGSSGSGGAGASGGTSGGGGTSSGGTSGAGGTGGGTGGTGGGTGGSGGAGGAGGTGGTGCVAQGTKPAPAGGEQVLAITGDVQPEYPVVDNGFVYWTTNLTLWRVDVNGTCLQNLATVSSGQLEGIAIDGGYVYVANTNASTIFRVPVAGGPVTPLVTNQAAQTVAVDATHLYWALPGAGIGRIPKGGGAMEIVATTGAGQAFAIAVDSTYVFAATRVGTLIRVPKGVSQPATQIDQAGGPVTNGNPVYLTLHEDRVFWTHLLSAGGGAVRSVHKDGQGPVALPATYPEGVATDGTSAYWANGTSGTGTISKANASLTTPINLATGQDRPRGVAIDSTHVYWTNFGDRTVRRIAR